MATIFISIGSNQDAARQIRFGMQRLDEMFSHLKLSKVYESEAVGFEGDNFLNLVAKAETQMTIAQVEQVFKAIEKEAGRRRDGEKFSDRALDIDLLSYDEVVCEQPIRLPRGEILYHAFVLQPLAEIEPERKHPIEQRSYQKLWQAFDKKEQQKLWPIQFDWQQKQR
ncbi:2-amino-4-hydroxy-6-hydroxymethyldihydropteridine diphosphokinase [Kangiella koreensis]|uniref:2-amino-4-hydroxy-6-hydroxymethyldihydropteridine diphosphokinase n=1 Tax=Kangiella koreensis (strain DSM 16069 / JCM 12317 / KCTC 12182 / SW-125) TaxID=523791 RepID=C7R7P2_KANKD|nr:2-amino-4-hydroxy-6-hydroxymethyldihydropteridine diphosphokinase [Kangiella koreensis]ACV27575.1 2-amino-4-hydroxy-6-hydroxymethyldihydropteridine pyrophosphokinase [Kangiella koreensis DSM 16069]